MTEKEIGEIRRRLRTDKCAVRNVYACLVNERREVAATFSQSIGLMEKDDADALLQLIRKALSGGIGKNLVELAFSTAQVMDSDEHRLFSALRADGPDTQEALRVFFQATAQTLEMEGNYMILLLQDSYDVPAYGKDGNREEDSTDVYNYCLCAVCPVKETKSSLGYFSSENTFRSIGAGVVMGAPEIGFLFPAFNDRTADIYDLLYYTKSSQDNHSEFIENVIRAEVPIPADSQKDLFNAVLADALSEDCSMEVAVAVRDTLCEQMEDHKLAKEEEPLVISKRTVSRVLEKCGVPEERVQAFEQGYDEQFGAQTELPPQNLVDVKELSVSTASVSIKIREGCTDLVQTRIIDGQSYILIRADSSVEVNGVSINIK